QPSNTFFRFSRERGSGNRGSFRGWGAEFVRSGSNRPMALPPLAGIVWEKPSGPILLPAGFLRRGCAGSPSLGAAPLFSPRIRSFCGRFLQKHVQIGRSFFRRENKNRHFDASPLANSWYNIGVPMNLTAP